ncbi:MAG: hypothetical protein FJW31_04345 [Acidobacteria bacterium]|nr:hypothetical protein [Acidobacteriota bacterium]
MTVEKGKLIALEGLNDRELLREGKQLLRARSGERAGGVSQWGASGLFFQLRQSTCPEIPSPKTLLMLYAADLEFRLRWEILPLMEEGLDVVAAPYVETASAFGVAAGIDAEWVERLFAFAPKPEAAFRLRKPSAESKGMPSHCFHILAGASGHWKKRSGIKPLNECLARLKALPAGTPSKKGK